MSHGTSLSAIASFSSRSRTLALELVEHVERPLLIALGGEAHLPPAACALALSVAALVFIAR